MAFGSKIRTYFNGTWHDGDVPVISAADHGAWLGSGVFDGARYFDGVAPDLLAHCARVNASAEALMLNPTVSAEDMVDIIWDGIRSFAWDNAIYLRPMIWGIDGDASAIVPDGNVGFAICLEERALAPPDATVRTTATRFRRPVLEDNVVNAKAGCLYPNNARMLREAQSKGYQNALVADAMGNLAESATANVFLVKGGEVLTPIPNGTFLAGITRRRHMINLGAEGMPVTEKVLSFEDVHGADEVFLSGNMSKVTPVTEFDGTHYQVGPVTRKVREMYWDWAMSERA
ncbi:MAG: branched-chain amino acid aminotransferase [Pseudomonadota bacterium]